jgi:nicotinamidase-related amidase
MTALRQAQLAQLAAWRPALVVVDVQVDFGDPAALGAYQLTADALAALGAAVTRIGQLVDAARELGVPVAWVELASDPDRPWKSGNWLRAGDYHGPMAPDEPCRVGTRGAQWYRMTPARDELRVAKRGYSGFLGTDLDARLRAAGYQWLTIAGLTSECCVDATARDAMQLNWPVVIPRDATAGYDLAVNAAALAQLALNVGVLSDTDEVIGLWKRQAQGNRQELP